MKILLDFIFIFLLYIFVFYKKWKNNKEKLILNTLMYIYISFVLYFTLMPIITSLPFIFNHPYGHMNLYPFVDVTDSRGNYIIQVILNIIMMMPFGILLPLIKNTNLKEVTLYTFLFSLGIEILQPLINGARLSDITDLITNTLGGIIGYTLYLKLKLFIERNLKLLVSYLK